MKKIPTLDKSRPYFVYCQSDNTSIAGDTKRVHTGFSPIYRLKGNYQSWVSAGYPIQAGSQLENEAVAYKLQKSATRSYNLDC
ncbi:MAG: rhodanese-like domain-containing protein [Methanoregula sp.]|nr:rhodanese-like domain-containing protein [Methanoregula sp.]